MTEESTTDIASGEAPEDDASIAPASPLEAMRDAAPEATEALRREWGAEFDVNIGHARAVAAAFADGEVRALLDETGLGDDPRIVRLAARIGRALHGAGGAGPDGAKASRPDGAGTGRPAAMIQAEIDRLTSGAEYWSAPVQRRVRELYLELHGNAPLAVHRDPGDGGAGW